MEKKIYACPNTTTKQQPHLRFLFCKSSKTFRGQHLNFNYFAHKTIKSTLHFIVASSLFSSNVNFRRCVHLLMLLFSACQLFHFYFSDPLLVVICCRMKIHLHLNRIETWGNDSHTVCRIQSVRARLLNTVYTFRLHSTIWWAS